MQLDEAKEILKKNGYLLKESDLYSKYERFIDDTIDDALDTIVDYIFENEGYDDNPSQKAGMWADLKTYLLDKWEN
jgi:hypothetical protein